MNPYISQFYKTEEIFVEYTDKPAVTTTAPPTEETDIPAEADGAASPVQTTTTINDPADNPAELEEDILNALDQLG